MEIVKSDNSKKHFYIIETSIEGKKHYYSHWERLSPTHEKMFPVWQEYLGYTSSWGTRMEANKMRSRLLAFDRRGKYTVKPIDLQTLNKARKKVVEMFGELN